MNGNEVKIFSNLINSGKPHLTEGVNQSPESLGENPNSIAEMNSSQVQVLSQIVLESFTRLVKQDLKKAIDYIGNFVAGEELEQIRKEISEKLNPRKLDRISNFMHQKRMMELRSCLEGVSGDNVL